MSEATLEEPKRRLLEAVEKGRTISLGFSRADPNVPDDFATWFAVGADDQQYWLYYREKLPDLLRLMADALEPRTLDLYSEGDGLAVFSVLDDEIDEGVVDRCRRMSADEWRAFRERCES